MRRSKLLWAAFIWLVITGCEKEEGDPDTQEVLQAENGEELSGGILNTIFNTSSQSFGFPSPGLTGDDELFFFVGNSFFTQNWVSAPASTTVRDGLGPVFNARACSSCHLRDGRGRPTIGQTGFSNGFLVRLSIEGLGSHGAPNPHPIYGDQLSDQALPGVPIEGEVSISYSTISGQFTDGTPYELTNPYYELVNLNFGSADVMTSPRIGQQVIGLGLLEAINESDIAAIADPLDMDGDGISGKPNLVWDKENQEHVLGRFGWKANMPNLKQQTAGAFLGDIGITSSLFPAENCTDAQEGCLDAQNGGSPEISDQNLDAVVLYMSNLAVPARRDVDNLDVLKGKKIFNNLGCASCHNPSFQTGVHPRFNHLSNQTIRPYTDLLLHDMGDELADGRPDFEANGNEWRTPPLWGIGLIETVNNHTFLLHDGRARNIEEAILWHGGEGEHSKQEYVGLNSADRSLLLKFLNSL